MVFLILVITLLLVILGSVGMGVVIIYHFKRLGIENDDNVKRFLSVFKIGGLIVIALSVLLLFLSYNLIQ